MKKSKFSLNGLSHSQIVKMGWEKVGVSDVDSGTIHIGDPCYILPSKEVGKIGYDFEPYLKQIKNQFQFGEVMTDNIHMSNQKLLVLCDQVIKGTISLEEKNKQCSEIIAERKRIEKIIKSSEYKKRQKDAFIKSTTSQLKHVAGHDGMSVSIAGFGGDGTYDVYVQRSKNGSVVAAMIKFGWNDDYVKKPTKKTIKGSKK